MTLTEVNFCTIDAGVVSTLSMIESMQLMHDSQDMQRGGCFLFLDQWPESRRQDLKSRTRAIHRYKLLAKDSFKIMTIDLQGQGSAEGRMPVGDVALSK